MMYECMNKDPLEECMPKSTYKESLDGEELNASAELIETVLNLGEENEEDVKGNEMKVQEAGKSSKGLILKELPKHFKYAFLGEEKSKPVIIAVDLTLKKKRKKVLETLKKYKEVIAWSMEDLKGISPSICMHKILMEENAKPSIERQRRLNPVMKEVVRKEILKWLNAGFIYSILDSP